MCMWPFFAARYNGVRDPLFALAVSTGIPDSRHAFTLVKSPVAAAEQITRGSLFEGRGEAKWIGDCVE